MTLLQEMGTKDERHLLSGNPQFWGIFWSGFPNPGIQYFDRD